MRTHLSPRAAAFAAACAILSGCADDPPPTDDLCEQAADNLVERFAEHDPQSSPVARRAAERQRKRFFETCRDTGTLRQARCAAEASTVAELGRCQ